MTTSRDQPDRATSQRHLEPPEVGKGHEQGPCQSLQFSSALSSHQRIASYCLSQLVSAALSQQL